MFPIFSACIKKNGHHPGGGDTRVEEITLLLRQVITERREEHVLVGGRRTTHTLPRHALHVRVLRSELDSASIAVVHLVPETARPFEHGAGVHRARCCRTWRKSSCAGYDFREATGCGQRLHSITNQLACRIQIRDAARVFFASVEVDVPLLGVEFQRRQTLVAADQGWGSIRMHRYIRQAGCSVAANSVSTQEVQSEIHNLVTGEAGIRTNSATGYVAVESPCRGWRSERRTRIHAVTLVGDDAEHFIVTESGFRKQP